MKKTSPAKRLARANEVAKANAYLARLPRDVAAGLRKLRATISAVSPNAEFGTSYGIPAFRVNGRPLVWFAAFKQHSSFFPGAAAIRLHSDELKYYKTSKGTVQFPHGKPPPAKLIAKLIKTRIAELEKRLSD
jgi:uncharacterized protein YdhG (YjbR/CyaY superfamily)